MFGSKSSSCVATFALRYHAESNRKRYGEEVVESTKKNMYVDDLVKSLRDVEEARAFRVKITEAFAEGGFDLCKWRSTHPEVLQEANEPPVPQGVERVSGASDGVAG